MRISLLEPIGVTPELIEELSEPIRKAGHEFIYYPEKTTDPAELIRRSMGCEVVTIANNPYPDQVVLAADQLKMLNVAFTGIDHVGLEACRAKGVQICNAANYSNQTVAELVIGMTIDLLRHMDEAQQRVHGGGTAAGLTGREIMGKTVGIIGTGRIGMITAKLFLAFGAKVIAYSRTEKPEAKALGITYLPLADVMAQSDIVSIHTPNNASTCGLISAEMIALMKPTALLINCARGPIVDSAALAAALGWAGETGEDGVLRLSDGRHKIELPVGRRALLDGMTIRLSGPTVERGGGRCLPLSDLCPLLGVQTAVTDRGVELTPIQAAL